MADTTGQISITIVTQSAELNKLIEQFNQGKITAEAFSAALNQMQRAAMAGSRAQAEIKAVQQQAATAVRANTQAILDQAAGLNKATAAAKEFQVTIQRTADEAIATGGINAPTRSRGATSLGMGASGRYDAWAQGFLSTHIQDEVTGNWRAMTAEEIAAAKGLDQIAVSGENTRKVIGGVGESTGRATNQMLGGFRAALLLRSGLREVLAGSQLFMNDTEGMQAVINKLTMAASDSAWVFMGLKPVMMGFVESSELAATAAGALGISLNALGGWLTLIPTVGLALLAFFGDMKAEDDKLAEKNKKVADSYEKVKEAVDDLTETESQLQQYNQHQSDQIQTQIGELESQISALKTLQSQAAQVGNMTIWQTYANQIDVLHGKIKKLQESISGLGTETHQQQFESQLMQSLLGGKISAGNQFETIERYRKAVSDFEKMALAGKITPEEFAAIKSFASEREKALGVALIEGVKEGHAKAQREVLGREGRPKDVYAFIDWFRKAFPTANRAAYADAARTNAEMLRDITRYGSSVSREQARNEAEAARAQAEQNARNPSTFGMALTNWASKFQGNVSPLQQTVNNVGDSVLHVTNAWSQAMAGMVTHTMKARDAWKMVEQAAVSAITNIIAKLIEMAVIQAAVRLIPGVGNILSTGAGLVSPGSSWGNTPIPGTSGITSPNLRAVNSLTQAAMSPAIHIVPSVTVHPIINNQGLAVQVAVGVQELNGRQMRM